MGLNGTTSKIYVVYVCIFAPTIDRQIILVKRADWSMTALLVILWASPLLRYA